MEKGQTRRDVLRHEIDMRLRRRAPTEKQTEPRHPGHLGPLGRYARIDPGMAALVEATAQEKSGNGVMREVFRRLAHPTQSHDGDPARITPRTRGWRRFR